MSEQYTDEKANVIKKFCQFRNDDFLKIINISDMNFLLFSSPTKTRIVRNFFPVNLRRRIDRDNIILTNFKINYDGDNVTYAQMFSYTKKNQKIYKWNILGPSFESQDGEYRANFTNHDKLNKIYDEYEKQTQIVESFILEKMSKGEIIFYVQIFSPIEVDDEIFKYIDENRLSIKYFVLCWILDYKDIIYNSQSNNINKTYDKIFRKIGCIELYNKVLDSFGSNKEKNMTLYLTLTHSIETLTLDVLKSKPIVFFGQKTSPISYNESANVFDINFDIWKELFILSNVGNLVINLISPSFPILNTWYYIHNTNKDYYDNPYIHKKYETSEKVEILRDQLIKIDKYNYLEKNPDYGPINDRFKQLSGKIRKAINYIESSMRLSRVSIAYNMEHAGKTLKDFPKIIKTYKGEQAENFLKMFNDINIAKKHVFEIIHGLYALNDKLGILHGDMHLNNITIYKQTFYRLSSEYNPRVIYKIKNKYYNFVEDEFKFIIIDFSRSLISNRKILSEKFGEKFVDKFYSGQKLKFVKMIDRINPNLLKNNYDKIVLLTMENFPLIVKIMMAIDPYLFVSSMISLINNDLKEILNEKSRLEFLEFLENIKKYLLDFMINYINKAIKGELLQDEDIEYPCYMIIEKYFSEFLIDQADLKKINIVDAFNHNNELKYDINEYDKLPPLARHEYLMELLEKYNKNNVFDEDIKELEKEIEDIRKYNDERSEDVEKISKEYHKKTIPIIDDFDWMFE